MEFKISEQPFIYREFLTYMMTIKGKSPNTIKEYASDLKIFFKFMNKYFNKSTDDINDVNINDLDYDFVKRIKLTDIYEYLSYIQL